MYIYTSGNVRLGAESTFVMINLIGPRKHKFIQVLPDLPYFLVPTLACFEEFVEYFDTKLHSREIFTKKEIKEELLNPFAHALNFRSLGPFAYYYIFDFMV